MIEILIAMVRTTGLNIAGYTAYRLEWEQRTTAQSLNAGRKGGSGGMKVRTTKVYDILPHKRLFGE